ncbi:uncharacterized protein LOC131335984 isoform X3 [Rhododendron vialii]|uniref:uncharacterized protein LOC131335984 isoform X3 n=1 Tax=Rhododendron vialii TaxID=182163 RepID=UPI00265EF6E9|nr:uncharacterized protein LOC131335984 isoform X3 [Rhododendron vialii]
MKKTSHSNAWLPRCKRLQENVEATFMDEAFEHAALDSDDLLYLKEQMEAEEDAERLLRRTEKRAFAAFKKSCKFSGFFTCISSLGSTCGVKAKEWNKTARFAEEGGGSQTQAAQSFKPV